MAAPPRAQRFRQDRQIVDPKTGFPTPEFLRNINSSFELLNYLASIQAAAEAAQDSADAAQATADAAVPQTTQIIAGVGLGGGGDLTTDRTIDLEDTAVTPGPYGSANSVPTFTVDQQGRLIDAEEVPISVNAGAVAGVALTKTDDTNVTLTLGGSPASALVAAASLTLGWTGTLAISRGGTGASSASSALSNLGAVATTRSISTGTGLVGGGNLSADRTLSLATSGVTAGSYGSALKVPTITVDAYGRVTIASENTIPALASGTYTPTLTGVANIDAVTAYACKYLRVGNIVHVAGKMDVDATAVALTQIGISLPIASNLATDGDARGGASSLVPETMVIRGDAVNDRAEMIYTAVSTANHGVSFWFTYEII